MWVVSEKMPTLGLSIPKPIITFMLAWLVIGFVQPFMPIGNAAHLIGLLAGIAMGLLDVCRRTS